MSENLTWTEVSFRLALTFVAGSLIGINRGEHARPAGLRTTLLVCLAASISMIQMNLLLNTRGKTPDSFVVMDLMRLPLGILSGMGFIGAGAILRKDGLAKGVTTAATLWFVTVMGLCLGGGQYGLGLAALVLALLVLWGLKHIEEHWKQERSARLTVTVGANGPDDEAIARLLQQANIQILSLAVIYANDVPEREYNGTIRWRDRPSETKPPLFLKKLAELPGVSRLNWQPQQG